MTDVLVVGGSISGVATAHRLAKRGCKVTLLEAGEGVGEGACFANGAMICPSQPHPWNGPGVFSTLLRSFVDSQSAAKLRVRALPSLMTWGWRFLRNSTPANHQRATQQVFALAQHSLAIFQDYVDRHAEDFDAARCGTMKVFRDQAALEGAIDSSSALARLGLRYELLDRGGVLKAEPQLAAIADELVGGIRYPDDIVGDANKFCRLLARDLVEMGSEVRTGCRVEALIAEGEGIVGARTPEGEVRARNTVLALGSDPDGLAARAGVRLPIRPVKGYSLTYDVSQLNTAPAVPVVDDSLHVGVIPLGTRLRVAGTADFAGYDRRVSPDRVAYLEGLLRRVYPDLGDELARRGGRPWTGFRPMSNDGLPFIGRTRRPGLWVNAGHGPLGWTLSAGSADLLADLLLGDPPKLDPGFLAVDR